MHDPKTDSALNPINYQKTDVTDYLDLCSAYVLYAMQANLGRF